MRKILAAVTMLALAGCAANSQVSEQAPIAAAGEYKLIAVNAQAVPQVISTGDEVVSGTLLLKQDGTFEVKTAMRTQMSSAQPLSFVRQQMGSYTSSPIGVQLNWQAGTVSSGAFFGRTLRFYHNGVEYLYLK